MAIATAMEIGTTNLVGDGASGALTITVTPPPVSDTTELGEVWRNYVQTSCDKPETLPGPHSYFPTSDYSVPLPVSEP
jgi:hypothetical protein